MMNKRIITKDMLEKFALNLRENERSEITITKYCHDLQSLMDYAGGLPIDKCLAIAYKAELGKKYALSSANSMIAAANSFFKFIGWNECCIHQFKIQKKVFCSEEKEMTKADYIRLVQVARKKGNKRLCLLLQTICGTGIRVSELQFITAEAVRRGEAIVSSKNKTRTVFLVRELQKKLLHYIREQKISAGPVFVTKTGKPMNRCNIWKEMKALCEEAEVSPDKVFPHNLRHLFARTFYGIKKDIAKLADVLGHSNIDTTRIYTISTGFEHRRQLESMRLVGW